MATTLRHGLDSCDQWKCVPVSVHALCVFPAATSPIRARAFAVRYGVAVQADGTDSLDVDSCCTCQPAIGQGSQEGGVYGRVS